MPYRWTPLPASAPGWRLEIAPHRSLPPAGFAAFIGITFSLFMVPVLALLGRPLLWVMLPFPMAALALTWILLRRSYRLKLREDLTITPDMANLTHTGTDGSRQEWHANPFWVRVELDPNGGPVENYLTLHGGPREVEIGSFLSPEERLELRHQLMNALAGNAPV